MIKRSFVVLAIIVLALITSAVLPTLSTTEAAGEQRTIWNASGLQQTSSTYWEPELNQPSDYVAPVDLAGGRAYMRLDVLEKPSDMFVAPMVCFWRHGAKKFAEETCAAGRNHPFTTEGTYYLDLGTPDSWWQKGGAFDWTQPVSLGRIMIRDGVKGGRLLLNERCGAACYLGDDLDDHVPITMSSQLIFVAEGQTLTPPSGWRNDCPGSWSSSCRGDEVTPVTTTPTAPNPTTPPTTPPTDPGTTTTTTTTTTVPTPPTTVPGPASLDIEPGVASLDVSYSIPRAVLYQVRYQPDGGKMVWTDPAEVTSLTLRDLQPGTRHTVSVRGLINGTWRSWMSSTATPLEAGGPGDTAPPTTTAPNEAYIDVEPGAWILTVSYGIPGAVLYQVRSQQQNRSWQWTEPTEATSQVLRALQPGVLHTVEVRGLVDGTWDNWISTTATPLADEPTPPGDLTVDIRAMDQRLRVSWTAADASTFQVRSKPATSSTWKLGTPTDKALVNLNGLTNGTAYDVEVRSQVDGNWQPWVSTRATPRS